MCTEFMQKVWGRHHMYPTLDSSVTCIQSGKCLKHLLKIKHLHKNDASTGAWECDLPIDVDSRVSLLFCVSKKLFSHAVLLLDI